MTTKHSNRLIHETSPYLLQHAHNPVDWYPWGLEALETARQENKPMLLSIGYSACHWCHVMAHESFENEAIAALMNELFVNIKVDREERPDLDHIYQNVWIGRKKPLFAPPLPPLASSPPPPAAAARSQHRRLSVRAAAACHSGS
jgi:uncharacterized protein YyaL (SSP411 family)